MKLFLILPSFAHLKNKWLIWYFIFSRCINADGFRNQTAVELYLENMRANSPTQQFFSAEDFVWDRSNVATVLTFLIMIIIFIIYVNSSCELVINNFGRKRGWRMGKFSKVANEPCFKVCNCETEALLIMQPFVQNPESGVHRGDRGNRTIAL